MKNKSARIKKHLNSGYGYDKHSAAVGHALAENKAFLEFLKDNNALKKAKRAKLYAVDSYRKGRKKELCFSISGKGLSTLEEFLRFFGCYTVAYFDGEMFTGTEYRSRK